MLLRGSQSLWPSQVVGHASSRPRVVVSARAQHRARVRGATKGQLSTNDTMASIQSLMARAQQQLGLLSQSTLERSSPRLATELKRKAEQHLETLMQLAERQQQQHLEGGSNSSSGSSDQQVQHLLSELAMQLDLEQEAARTAAASAAAANTNTNSNSTNGQLQQQLQEREAEVQRLQQQLQVAADDLLDHNELQMVYDKQCQDMYKLRMQLQQVQHQGHDAAASAAQVVRQHKQDLAWLMQAHQKELNDAHRKHQELIKESQAMRLKVLEQEQQLWSRQGAGAGGPPAAGSSSGGDASTAVPEQQQQQQQQAEGQQAVAAAQGTQQLAQQQQEQLQLEVVQLQETATQLASDKQQLQRNLQDMQREQAVLMVELQHLRDADAAAAAASAADVSSVEAAVAAAKAEGAAAAEQQLMVQLTATEQQRDKVVAQISLLESSLQEAKAAAAAAAAGSTLVAAPAALSGVDASAAVAQLKVAKMQMAELRVQLADARRELRQVAGRAGAAEAALQQQAADYETRLSKLQAWYSKQAAVVAELRKGKAPKDGQVGFTNTNRFWVRQELLFEFLKHWVVREGQLQQQEGFLGLQVQPLAAVSPDGGVDAVVTSLWESIPAWEAWSKGVAATQQHMPSGVYQYVPGKGEGFPEAFVPFRDYDAAVNAKY